MDLFRSPREWNQLRQDARKLHIDWLVLISTDPVWVDRRSWVWTVEPAFANENVRVFRVP